MTSHNGDSATLYAVWKINTYTVTFNVNGSGLSRSTSSVSITYGKTGTVTITPSAGYYLYAKSCTNGYTVNGSTGTGATGAQTITISNNSKTANSTCTFTGAALTIAQACAKLSVGQYNYAGSFRVAKLSGGKCWTTSASATIWSKKSCPSGTSVATAPQADTLLSAYGGYANTGWGSPYGYSISIANTQKILAITGWNGHHWLATVADSSNKVAWCLALYTSSSYNKNSVNVYGDNYDNASFKSICVTP